ncbi:MAG: CAP domain-containing protein [Candidatus Melainabacteria bacterium]|nr:CAP domain-containing protein [Candidatus Melainabacteria bacterium]
MKEPSVKKILACLFVLGSLVYPSASRAQEDGPFDESEPPFAPSFRRPGFEKANIVPAPQPMQPAEQNRERRKNKPKKSDDSSNAPDEKHIQTLEKQLFDLVNTDRAKHNQPPLKYSPRLSEMAKAHAQDMMKKNFFSHTNKEGLDAQARAAKMNIGIGVYENIAYQQGDIEDSDKVINLENDFMSEPEGPKNHRYNILYPAHTSVGVGVVIKGDKLILVEEFTDRPPTGEN